ncbi:MAG: GNAT family N-acetyltransferase [Pirellulales bacterium]
MSHVLEINDLEELGAYRLLWNSLLPETRDASFFQSLDWLEVYWRHYGRDQKLRVLVVFAGGRPIGILPLVVRTEPTRLGPVRVLTYPLHDWGTFYSPIGPHPTATLAAGLGHVRRTGRDWDLVDLRWIDALGADRGRTVQAMRAAGFRPGRQIWTQAAMVDLRGTWAEYWAGRNARWRANVRRDERRLAEQGALTLLRYRPGGAAVGDGDPRWDLYDACEQIAGRSWQGSSETGTTLSHASIREFLRETHAAAARVGGLDLNLLLWKGQPVAFAYNYHYRGNVSGLRMGFDASRCRDGAGTVLQARILEDSFRRGDRLYDLGPGSLHCKRYWHTAIVSSFRYTHFPAADLRMQVLRLKRWLGGQFASVQETRTAAQKTGTG